MLVRLLWSAVSVEGVSALEQTAYSVLNAVDISELAVALGVRASLLKLGLAQTAGVDDATTTSTNVDVVQTAKLMKLGCVNPFTPLCAPSHRILSC